MAKNDHWRLRKLIKGVASLGRTPKDADEAYFENLQDKIMAKIEPQLECCEVQENLVDLIEGTINEEKSQKMHKHLEQCEACTKDYELTLKLVESTDDIRAIAPNSSYFESLPGRIEQRLFDEGIQTPCEKAMLYIADKLADEELPKDVEAHLEECEDCARELVNVENMIGHLKDLYIPSPSQKYFEEMLENIDRKIEALPSHRIDPEYQKVKVGYLADLFDSLRTAIMHPYVAVALSAMVTLIVVGGKFFSSSQNIEEKQINLSDVISKSPTNVDDQMESGINVYSTAHRDDGISDPTDDERLQINTTGSAKKEDAKDKNKKLN